MNSFPLISLYSFCSFTEIWSVAELVEARFDSKSGFFDWKKSDAGLISVGGTIFLQ